MAHPQPGSLILVRGERWQLAKVDAFDRCAVLTLDGRDAANLRRRLHVIEPFDRPVALPGNRLVRRQRRAVLRAALAAGASAQPPLGLWTAARASIDLHAYQLEPALAVLRGATRVLLADAVGLGKTIQAGLILAELAARGWADRALVLCPPGLRGAWAAELQRFGIAATVLDQAALAARLAALPPGTNPWTGHAVTIASVDLVKRPEVMAALDEVLFDVVVADEAHHLTPGTDRGAAVDRLAARAPWCVLLSATPHSGDPEAFAYLTRLGAHGDALTTFRRSRRDAGLASARRTRVQRVTPTAAEAALGAAVERYARAIWRARGGTEPAVQLVAITLARRAASSTRAVARTLARRLSLLGAPPGPAQPDLPWDDEAVADGDGDAAVLGCRGLADEVAERAAIKSLLALADAAGPGAKIRWLRRSLARLREPVIVFSEYRDTVEALLDALPAGVRAVSISGASPAVLRARAVTAFNDGEAELLVATDAAGEGLNLHHRCRLVIDCELPWNPVRLEQRLGRVDRLGQRRRVHAIRLCDPDGIEARVLAQLRVRQAQAGLAEEARPITELEVAHAVLGDKTILPAPAGAAIPGTSVAAAPGEAARLRWVRALPSSPTADAAWCMPRRVQPAAWVALHASRFTNTTGGQVAEGLQAHVIHTRAPGARRAWRGVLASVLQSDRFTSALRHRARGNAASAWHDLAPLRAAVTARLDAIRSRIARDRVRAVQRSLFDRRADAGADRADDIAGRLDRTLALRRTSVSATVASEGVSTRLVAVWPRSAR